MLDKLELEPINQIQYGLFIVSSFAGEKGETINAQIATVVFQVTCAPIQIVTCINKSNLTHQFISTSNMFGVTILSQNADLKFIGRFGFRTGRDFDKFAGINYKKSASGTPLVLDNATGILELKVVQTIDCGTHTLFVGNLLTAEKLSDQLPMTYDYYHNVIKGKDHKNAPTCPIKPIS